MKCLVIGDPHFRIDNLSESDVFISQLKDWLASHSSEIDHIIVLGDILHTHEKLHTFALNSAFKFFRMISSFSSVYCLVGNHDATSNTIFLSDNHWLNVFKGWKNITIVDQPVSISSKQLKVICCPYVPDGRFVEALRTVWPEGEWKTANCIFAHQLLDGAKMGAITAENVEKWNGDYPMLISGHIHDKQRVQPNLYYTGSSMQHAFGESEDKSLCLVTVHPNGVDTEDVWLQIKKKKIIYASIGEDLEKVKAKCEQADPNTEIKLVIKGTQEELKSLKKTNEFKELEKHTKKIQLKSTIPTIAERSSEFATEHTDKLFVDVLKQQVESLSDPFATSFLNSMLYNTEDLSDKDVLIIQR